MGAVAILLFLDWIKGGFKEFSSLPEDIKSNLGPDELTEMLRLKKENPCLELEVG